MLFQQPLIHDQALIAERDAITLQNVVHVQSAPSFYSLAPRFGLSYQEARKILIDARASVNLLDIKAATLNSMIGKQINLPVPIDEIHQAIDYDPFNMRKALELIQSERDIDPHFEHKIEHEAVAAIQPRLEGFCRKKVRFLCVDGISHQDWVQEASAVAALAVRWSWPFRQDHLYSGVAWNSARNWIINQIYHRTIPANNPYVRDAHGNSIYRLDAITGEENWAIESDPSTAIAYEQICQRLSETEREAIWLICMDSRANFPALLNLIQKVYPEIQDCFEASENPWYKNAVARHCKMSVSDLNGLLKNIGSKMLGMTNEQQDQ